ncbi:TIGR03086 family metal-binding protein, partial [Nocardiopsis lucentensis]|uniref:TIGR03086 family metal-binding protein n=1 Tax=Nocardiopsis lucentensis TaxID=53441 RepID=UPI00036DC735
MPELIDLHATAMTEFDHRVRQVGTADWALPTPCADWDVHDLVNHLTTEQLWVPPLLGGARIEDVGDRFDGDNLGEEPVATWAVAAREARLAWLAPDAVERTVHLSAGTVPARRYLWEMTFDLAVHAFDLARALGADERLDPVLVSELCDWAGDQGLGPGPMFDEPVAVGPDAAPQDR